MVDYNGVIIEESLGDKDVLGKIKIIRTTVEDVIEKHKTPWVQRWTLHAVEVAEGQVDEIAEELSKALDSKHPWYADFKNDAIHYIIFRNKIFKVDRSKPEQYDDVIKHGVAFGIPDYQLDFSPHIKR